MLCDAHSRSHGNARKALGYTQLIPGEALGMLIPGECQECCGTHAADPRGSSRRWGSSGIDPTSPGSYLPSAAPGKPGSSGGSAAASPPRPHSSCAPHPLRDRENPQELGIQGKIRRENPRETPVLLGRVAVLSQKKSELAKEWEQLKESFKCRE